MGGLIKTPILKCFFQEHKKLKKEILEMINSSKADNLYCKDSYMNDAIYRLDWKDSNNFERNWVKVFKPHLENTLKNLIYKIGLTKIILYNVWYQQYQQQGKHGWHTHGNNFTGVYYLDFDKKIHPTTDILNPLNPKEIISMDTEEGDLIAFPSYLIHRGGLNLSKNIKTIISFNFDVQNPAFKYIKN